MAAVILSALVTSVPGRAGNEVYVGVQGSGKSSIDLIDHSDWTRLLSKYVDDDGMVNYEAWKASASDVKALDRYLAHLSTAGRQVRAKRNAQLAFWINAYNAVTIRGILREYPTTSIRNHTPVLWGYHIWKDLKLYVGGEAFSLDEIEHQILRKMSEPRIHFAIVCASISCPRLLHKAYTAEQLEGQLDDNAKDFFRRRRNFRHDVRGSRFYLSAILDWFSEDFGTNQQAVLKRIAAWLPTPAAVSAAEKNDVSVSYLDYNWNLNSREPTAQKSQPN